MSVDSYSENNSKINTHIETSITNIMSIYSSNDKESNDSSSSSSSYTPSSISNASSTDTQVLPSGEYILNRNEPKTFLNSYDLEKVTDSEIYPQKRLFSFLHSKKIKEVPQDDNERTTYPLFHANILSSIYFWWVTPIIKTGYKRTIQPNDLFKMDEKLSVEKMHATFQKNLDWYIQKAKDDYLKQNPNATNDEVNENIVLPKFTLIKTLLFTFKYQFLLACVFA